MVLESHHGATKATEWIETNFDSIAYLSRLKADLSCTEEQETKKALREIRARNATPARYVTGQPSYRDHYQGA